MKSNYYEIGSDQIHRIKEHLRHNSNQLTEPKDLGPLIEKIGDARIVMIGEASHGTGEYYAWRNELSKKLIEEKKFDFIAVEGDWPPCYEVNRYVKHKIKYEDPADLLTANFIRWPQWMYCNQKVEEFVNWLDIYNGSNDKPIGFFGLDLYSLQESIESVIQYLQSTDQSLVKDAEKAAECFTNGEERDGSSYARKVRMVPEDCEEDVVKLLASIIEKRPTYDSDREAVMSNEMNARVAVNAENYYRNMVSGRASWNIRDQHMMEVLNHLLEFHGPDSKAVVWAHNTHIGDARGTDMESQGVLNIGQLAREQYEKSNCFLVGMGSFKGTVTAGSIWGGKQKEMKVPPARERSWEAFCHETQPKDKMIMFPEDRSFDIPLGHRAIGVVYEPEDERYGNYVPTVMPTRYDSFLYLDETNAIQSLKPAMDTKKTADTFPHNK